MLLNFREKYKILYTTLKNNSKSVYFNKVVDLNTAALPSMIMKFFIKNYGFFRAA